MDAKAAGQLGEETACFYLKRKGYKILDRNYFKELSAVQKGEIDIVAKKDGIFSFIEVKTSISPFGKLRADFFPEDRVDFQKQKQLVKLAQIWLSEKKIPLDSPWQIDVIAITADLKSQKAKIRHFQNAVC